MPLKLVAPRSGKSPNWTIRGTHLGIAVDRSTKTRDRRVAAKALAKVRDEIETGAFAIPGAATFAGAALAYMQSGKSRKFMKPLLLHFRDAPLSTLDQSAIDRAAVSLYPKASAATRNRHVYTPVSAVLRRAGVVIALRRPAGAQGRPRAAWLPPEDAFAVLRAGRGVSAKFGALLAFLLYTGARLSEALAVRWADVDLEAGEVVLDQTKAESARTAFLPANVVVALRPLRGGRGPADRVFRLTKSGALYTMLDTAATAAGVVIPERVAFHIFRHTWATWMRRFGGLDTAALVGTGAWKSRKSASVYEHVDVTAEARKVAQLPVE